MQINFLKYFPLMQLHTEVFHHATLPRHNDSFKTKNFRLRMGEANLNNAKHQKILCFWCSRQPYFKQVHCKPKLYHIFYNTVSHMLQWSQLYSRLPFSQTITLVLPYLGRYVNEVPLWLWGVCPSTLTRRRREGIPASTHHRPDCQTASH